MLNILNRKIKTEKEIELEGIKKDIRACEELMSRNETIFNMTSDETIIESKIYEREALLRQYDYLVKLMRQRQKAKDTVKIGE